MPFRCRGVQRRLLGPSWADMPRADARIAPHGDRLRIGALCSVGRLVSPGAHWRAGKKDFIKRWGVLTLPYQALTGAKVGVRAKKTPAPPLGSRLTAISRTAARGLPMGPRRRL
jgi:hypothetical protein